MKYLFPAALLLGSLNAHAAEFLFCRFPGAEGDVRIHADTVQVSGPRGGNYLITAKVINADSVSLAYAGTAGKHEILYWLKDQGTNAQGERLFLYGARLDNAAEGSCLERRAAH
jgi:hypothetical protein